jgi:uncharacterized cupredoxin-like copper-binding protein
MGHAMGNASVPRRAVGWAAAACVVAGVLLPACSSGTAPHPSAGPVVKVTERDFEIRLSRHRVRSGPVVLQVTNRGPVAHEVLVVRAEDGPLPLRADDVTIDEDAIEDITVGVLEPDGPGTTRDLELDLEPGMYSLVCNMSGHFMGGMYADLEVTA